MIISPYQNVMITIFYILCENYKIYNWEKLIHLVFPFLILASLNLTLEYSESGYMNYLYGGSSLTLLLFAVGVLANISMFNKYEKKYKNK